MLRSALIVCLLGSTVPAATLEQGFEKTVKPFVTAYCSGCHGGKAPVAQFNMQRYTTMSSVVDDFGHWNLVLDRIAANQMPPKGGKQPTDTERQAMVSWIRAVRSSEAQKRAGDPGPVLARRLSNAEYNYTIRDLTGVDLQPAKEFPVDPANPEGFDNSGESLNISPALLNKYLQAARDVGNHMVLTPDGFIFAPHTMLVETDREKFAIQRIVDFYFRQPTDYADYFLAAWQYKHRAAQKNPRATLASIAAKSKLSAKYLPMVWSILEDPSVTEAGPVAKLRTMWRALPASGSESDVRAKCVEMRDYVKRMRRVTAMEFSAPRLQGLAPTSQPLMNHKLRLFNTNRRKFDKTALRMEGDPPPQIPQRTRMMGGLGQEAAFRASIIMAKLRVAEKDIVIPAGESREKWEAAFEKLADVFPDNFFISERGRFYPDDSEDKGRLLSAGYHNVMGYWRDDQPLRELILDEAGKKELERLWLEFEYMGDYTIRTWVQYYFNQSGEIDGRGRESGSFRPPDAEIVSPKVIFGLQEQYLAKATATKAEPTTFEAIRYHFNWINDTIRSIEKVRAEAEPQHIQALLPFAAKAWRRPLTDVERTRILDFYKSLRGKSALTHEEAIRDSVVGILMSPNFLFRVPEAAPAQVSRTTVKGVPLSSYALANRLSYFLWSSMPDAELLSHAAKGDLTRPEVLRSQVRRMLKDDRARGLATEFAGNWLEFRRFEDLNSVDRGRFPNFTNELRSAMFEEPVRFVDDVIRNDRPVLDLLYGKHTFVNPVLAKHYGIPNVTGRNDNWVRIDDATKYGRGGVLPMAAFLTLNAPGLRTSPVKRGYWVVRRVLGETIPPPPPNVPELPADEAKADMPLRDMLAKHRENPLCAACHARFDSFGLAFENYGPTGERRTADLAGRPVDTKASFPGGMEGSGYEAVLSYIRQHRQKDFLVNLSRKLLAYSLNRSLLLSDDPAVEKMTASLAASGYRFSALVEAIVTSPQFVNRRAEQVSAAPTPQIARAR